MSRFSLIRGTFWNHFELVILGVMFFFLIVTDMFWIAVSLPYGAITLTVTAQILYWWASPRWKVRFPRITKSMLRGEIAELKYRLSVKNRVVKGYFKSLEYHMKENRRLTDEVEALKNELAEVVEARTLVEDLPESFLVDELSEAEKESC